MVEQGFALPLKILPDVVVDEAVDVVDVVVVDVGAGE